jgi:hypothetical protein
VEPDGATLRPASEAELDVEDEADFAAEEHEESYDTEE